MWFSVITWLPKNHYQKFFCPKVENSWKCTQKWKEKSSIYSKNWKVRKSEIKWIHVKSREFTWIHVKSREIKVNKVKSMSLFHSGMNFAPLIRNFNSEKCPTQNTLRFSVPFACRKRAGWPTELFSRRPVVRNAGLVSNPYVSGYYRNFQVNSSVWPSAGHFRQVVIFTAFYAFLA